MIMIILFVTLIVTFFSYKIYQFRRNYRIVEKFSINTGEGIEYYFVLQRNKNIFKIKVCKEDYDFYDPNDYINIV